MLNEATLPQPASSSHVPFTVVVVIDAALVRWHAASADSVENHRKKGIDACCNIIMAVELQSYLCNDIVHLLNPCRAT